MSREVRTGEVGEVPSGQGGTVRGHDDVALRGDDARRGGDLHVVARVEGAQLVPDDLQRRVGVTLLDEDEADPLDVRAGVLPVPGPAAVGGDEVLLLEETDLGHRDGGELPHQGLHHLPDRHDRVTGDPSGPGFGCGVCGLGADGGAHAVRGEGW